MTLIWFVIWLVSNTVGDREPLSVDPVNWWAGTLILVVALDLARQHAPEFGSSHTTPSSAAGAATAAPKSDPGGQ